MFTDDDHVLSHRFDNGNDTIHVFQGFGIGLVFVLQTETKSRNTMCQFFYIVFSTDILNNVTRQFFVLFHLFTSLSTFRGLANSMLPSGIITDLSVIIVLIDNPVNMDRQVQLLFIR